MAFVSIVAAMTPSEESPAPEPADYTRDGDDGHTEFGGHGRVAKRDARVAASAECDEANASISVAVAIGGLPINLTSMLASVQNDLFDLTADLSVPLSRPETARARIVQGHIDRLERAAQHFAADSEGVSGTVLPGGTAGAALLYMSRAVVRRAERAVWIAVEEYPDTVNPVTARYLNRLSSLLFVLARGANAEHGDIVWIPEASVQPVGTDTAAAQSPDE
ncbi:cob(I)yrinic acid a,c-diamide adenosyltransferase [Arthrobacter sp. R1-13]